MLWVPESPRLSNRNGQFQNEVPAHVEHAPTACDHVQVGVFQAAQVVLVAHIGQVVDHWKEDRNGFSRWVYRFHKGYRQCNGCRDLRRFVARRLQKLANQAVNAMQR